MSDEKFSQIDDSPGAYWVLQQHAACFLDGRDGALAVALASTGRCRLYIHCLTYFRPFVRGATLRAAVVSGLRGTTSVDGKSRRGLHTRPVGCLLQQCLQVTKERS